MSSPVEAKETPCCAQTRREGERQLQRALSAAGMWVWEWLVAEDRVTFSEHGGPVIGGPVNTLEEFFALVHPEDREPIRAALETTVRTATPLATQFRIIRPDDGRVRWIELRGDLDHNEPLRLSAVGADITMRKQADDALRLTQLSVDLSSDAVFWITEDGRFAYVNEAACRNLGYTRAELLAMTARDVDPHFSPERWADRWTELRVRRSIVFETTLRTRDGSLRPFEVTANYRDIGGIGCNFAFARDIAERKRAEATLRESEARFRATFKQAAVGMGQVGRDGRFLRVNRRLCDITGYSEDELCGLTFKQVTHPDDLETDVALSEDIIAGRIESFSMEKRYLRKDGSAVWVNLSVSGVWIDGAFAYFLGVSEDISARKRVEDQLRLAARALESAADGVLIVCGRRVVSVNRAFTAITGYSQAEVQGQPESMLLADQQEEAHYTERRRALTETGVWHGELWGRRKDGDVFPALVSISAVRDSDDTHYVSVFTDVSAAKAYEAQLHHLAHRDALTELPNRVLFQQRLREALPRAQRDGHLLAVLFIDLDLFKPINDSLGHAVGDHVLRVTAHRLQRCVRGTDTVARIGGDEFTVLLDQMQDPDEAGWMAQSLIELVSQPIRLGERELFVTASLGISCYPQDGDSMEMLLKHADVAMYRAKQSGRNSYRFFAPEMNEHAAEKLMMIHGLRQAVDRHEFLLNYQPRVSLSDGALLGVEALVRWLSPEHGLILPTRFIGSAEETGIIEPIGDWVLQEACRQMRRWLDEGAGPRFVSVNLSPRQFSHPQLAARVKQILDDTGLQPDMLELEITESAVMHSPDRALAVLTQLAELGIHLSLDDFGTGHSSLSHLRRFPITHLKIDGSFIRDVPNDPDSAAIARTIIAMARTLRLSVTAEGVETQEQLEFLAAEGCTAGQGFLFGRPAPPEELDLRPRALVR